ncbi:hypothetical protein MUK42_20945 [Musa troglodytarum]|uniref:Uncharacterized protein n=1 Tax=Musa troglodytarum TaxID=320322 RepID=A0A9E7FR48_9LILI|nr:hypothetical protein MUK42_20945 [Musa troglodytarum]
MPSPPCFSGSPLLSFPSRYLSPSTVAAPSTLLDTPLPPPCFSPPPPSPFLLLSLLLRHCPQRCVPDNPLPLPSPVLLSPPRRRLPPHPRSPPPFSSSSSAVAPNVLPSPSSSFVLLRPLVLCRN